MKKYEILTHHGAKYVTADAVNETAEDVSFQVNGSVVARFSRSVVVAWLITE